MFKIPLFTIKATPGGNSKTFSQITIQHVKFIQFSLTWIAKSNARYRCISHTKKVLKHLNFLFCGEFLHCDCLEEEEKAKNCP